MKQIVKYKLLLKYVQAYLWLINKQEEINRKDRRIIIDVDLMFRKIEANSMKEALEQEIARLKEEADK